MESQWMETTMSEANPAPGKDPVGGGAESVPIPVEPEAPAHEDPDPEIPAHAADPDLEAIIDEPHLDEELENEELL